MGDKNISANIKTAAGEMRQMLKDRTIPFWLDRSVDAEFGGYLVCIDQDGSVNPGANKMIITQTRMLWGFSALLAFAKKDDIGRMESAANQGYEFLIKNFWDGENGGFFWETLRSGELVDGGKLTYAQSFAIYALCQYYLAYKNPEALAYAEKTFDLLQKYAADNLYGGYFENLEQDWSASPGGVFAGDRKSLDIHMHLMEAFTVLYQASGK
ncbi:MAG: AGE family epimerase/isomerase, partial [Oscillospiraceae bacterium]|nr:AGE family epimerase/isomerase [Oscillospiraceae bacterium]